MLTQEEGESHGEVFLHAEEQGNDFWGLAGRGDNLEEGVNHSALIRLLLTFGHQSHDGLERSFLDVRLLLGELQKGSQDQRAQSTGILFPVQEVAANDGNIAKELAKETVSFLLIKVRKSFR